MKNRQLQKDLIDLGWYIETNDGIHKGLLIKKQESGRILYMYIYDDTRIGISDYTPSVPGDLWSMSKKGPVFYGRCSNIEDFLTIYKFIE